MRFSAPRVRERRAGASARCAVPLFLLAIACGTATAGERFDAVYRGGTWTLCEQGAGECQAPAGCTLRRLSDLDSPVPVPANARDDFSDAPHDSQPFYLHNDSTPHYYYSEWAADSADCPSYLGTFACVSPYHVNFAAGQCQ